MIRTRVGYAGGSKDNPTYYSLGDHTETVQIDYDPEKLSYDDLLKVFWSTHNPCYRPYSRQYASLILYHNDQQKKAALRTKQAEVNRRREKVHTEVLPLSRFYLAEDYHQKYYLQSRQVFKSHFRSIYPDLKNFVDSVCSFPKTTLEKRPHSFLMICSNG